MKKTRWVFSIIFFAIFLFWSVVFIAKGISSIDWYWFYLFLIGPLFGAIFVFPKFDGFFEKIKFRPVIRFVASIVLVIVIPVSFIVVLDIIENQSFEKKSQKKEEQFERKQKLDKLKIFSNLLVLNSGCTRNAYVNDLITCHVSIKNTNKNERVKDITVRWKFYGGSGTVIGAETETFYEVIKPGQTRRFKKELVLTGASSQSKKLNCEIVNAQIDE